jgi:hypothetical protein
VNNDYNVKNTTDNSTATYSSIVSNITNNQPLVVGIAYSHDTTGHVFGIRGYYTYTENSQQDVYYTDPGEGSYHYMSYSTFVNNTGVWTWSNGTLKNLYV